MSISASVEFIEASEGISELITKFGGQPVWFDKPEWPLSKETGKPMEFICQIELNDKLFPNLKGKMAYLFMTEEEEYVDGTWEPDGGENAIIVQPGIPNAPVVSLLKGPTIKEYIELEGYDQLQPKPIEFLAQLSIKDEPDYASEEIRSNWSDAQFEEYAQALEGNKVGGVPIFLQADEFPSDGEYILLLQLDATKVPFFVNFGDAGIGYAFINSDGTSGKFLWQCA